MFICILVLFILQSLFTTLFLQQNLTNLTLVLCVGEDTNGNSTWQVTWSLNAGNCLSLSVQYVQRNLLKKALSPDMVTSFTMCLMMLTIIYRHCIKKSINTWKYIIIDSLLREVITLILRKNWKVLRKLCVRDKGKLSLLFYERTEKFWESCVWEIKQS